MSLEMIQTERREFLTQALTLVGGCVCSGLLVGCETDVLKSSNIAVRLDVANESRLAQVGGMIKKVFEGQNGGFPVIIVRQTEKDFLVFSTVCPHQGCEVNLPTEFVPEVWCPCHGSVFNKTTGAVLQGPATAPLPRFESAYDKSTNLLTITF